MIPEQYQFSTFREFYKKRKIIRKMFACLDCDEQWRYRYYVYSRCRLILVKRKDPFYFQDFIWDYLKGYHNDKALENIYYCNGGKDV